MRIDTQIVGSLGEYADCMSHIAGDISHPQVLWYRGLSDINHSLIPSLFRDKARVTRGTHMDGNYSSLHYSEDIRTQHYIAKNYHFFQNVPSSRVEWLEVMQHHGVKTRVLDWSESSIHSLLFAVEPFLDNQRYKSNDRKDCVPCVWVLEPQKLNRNIYKYIDIHLDFVKLLLKELCLSAKEEDQVLRNLKGFSEYEIYGEARSTKHIDYILNLSAINDEVLRDRIRLKEMLLRGDIINPYYYVAARIYSDGYILNNRELPPLAVVHPYHSERIKAQKGVFTVFPFYMEEKVNTKLRNIEVNPDAMENNAIAGGCLHKIIIDSPQKIAGELIANGMNVSWLYPELPIVSNEIENHRVYD